MSNPSMRSSAFTAIELLITVAIIAILAIAVILIINPSESLKQSRDTARIADMATLTTNLANYASQQGVSMGNANTVYVSIPDRAATSTAGDQCQGLGLPALPAIYTYHCAASSTLHNIDGTGWIPVNFNSGSGYALGIIPVDPVNTSSSRDYYTYTTNGTKFEVTAAMESQKFKLGGSNDMITNDGGPLATVYEQGTKLGLEPLDYGDTSLIGWWPLNEGTGTVAYDDSGNNATGTWSGTPAGGNSYYDSGGKPGYSWAGHFNGSNDTIITSAVSNISLGGNPRSAFAWISATTTTGGWHGLPDGDIIDYGTQTSNEDSDLGINNIGQAQFSNSALSVGFSGSLSTTTWNFIGLSYNGTNVTMYWNRSAATIASTTFITNTIGNIVTLSPPGNSNGPYTGLLNDVRLYNRALSPAEVAAIYTGSK